MATTISPTPTSPRTSHSPTPSSKGKPSVTTPPDTILSTASCTVVLAGGSEDSASPAVAVVASPTSDSVSVTLPPVDDGTDVHSSAGKDEHSAIVPDAAAAIDAGGDAAATDEDAAASADDNSAVSLAGNNVEREAGAASPLGDRYDDTTAATKISEDICFHVDADLLIQVIRNDYDMDVYFRVSSGNFACASTVWRLDLYGSSNLRSSQDDYLPVDIGDSHPDALATLMNIVHYRFGEVPTNEIGLSELYQITQLTEKFLCTHLIRPWATTWIKNKALRDFLAQNGTSDGSLIKMGIKIAWELGASSLLKAMAEAMIMSVIVDEDGDLHCLNGEKLKDLSLPPSMFNTISEIRLDVVSKLLMAIQQPFDKLASNHRFCALNEHGECDATMLGSLAMQLASHGLFPVPSVSNYKGTLGELEALISNIRLKRWEGKDIFPHLSHIGCNLGIANNAKAAMEGMQFPLEAPYTEHLENQRSLSGIPAEE